MNTSGFAGRMPPAPRQPAPEETRSEPRQPAVLRRDERSETSAALGTLFFNSSQQAFLTADDPAAETLATPDWQMLHQELRSRTADRAPADCAFTLLLPESGEVDVTMMARQPAGWEIALRFPPASCRHWQRKVSECRRLLSQSLNGPVRLTIEQGAGV